MSHKNHHNSNNQEDVRKSSSDAGSAEAYDDAEIKSCDRRSEEDCLPPEEEPVNSGVKDNEAGRDSTFNATESHSALEQTPEFQIAELELKVAELKDMYVRSQAEIQNIQRRNTDEQKKTREYAISNFAKDLVVVKDYLEMALKDESGNFEMLKMGVDLTLKQLSQVFDNHKIKEITPKALDKLDPHLHQAMDTVEAPGQEPNTIVTVMQKGYVLHERVLRPAMVTVAK